MRRLVSQRQHARSIQHHQQQLVRRRCPRSPIWFRSFSVSELTRQGIHHAPPPAEGEQDPVLRNQVGVQLLSKRMHDQVFGVKASFPPLDERALQISKDHLERHGLAQKESPILPSAEFTLPALQGSNIEEHFYNLGLAHAAPYLDLAKDIASEEVSLPEQPQSWEMNTAGWVRYEQDGSFEPIDYPTDNALVFDVETLYKVSPFPVMATAASKTHWYSWTSPWLLGETQDTVQLLPFPGKKPTLLIGHNVGYDRARVKEEYHLQRTQNRFLDTMSLHVAVRGLSSHQRIPWMKYRKRKKLKEEGQYVEDDEGELDLGSSGDAGSGAGGGSSWKDMSSMNSLADVAKLHCGIDVDKSARDWFGSDSKDDILAQFQELMTYCAGDVSVTHKIYKKVFPAFLENCPNPVTFAGVLSMGSAVLPVDNSWTEFIERADGIYNEFNEKVEMELFRLADEARKLIGKRDEATGKLVYELDPWLRQLDWSPKKARHLIDPVTLRAPEFVKEPDPPFPSAAPSASPSSSSTSPTSSATTASTRASNPNSSQVGQSGAAKLSSLVGRPSSEDTPPSEYPPWFEALLVDPTGRKIISKAWERLVPLLLQLSWDGHPLRYNETYGWYYAVPESEDSSQSKRYPNPIQEPLHGEGYQCYTPFKAVKRSLFSVGMQPAIKRGELKAATEHRQEILQKLCELGVSGKGGDAKLRKNPEVEDQVVALARAALEDGRQGRERYAWSEQLDWGEWTGAHLSGAEPGPLTKQAAPAPLAEHAALDDQSDELPESPAPVRRNGRNRLLPDPESDGSEVSLAASPSAASVSASQSADGDPTSSDEQNTEAKIGAIEEPEADFSDSVWPMWYWEMWRPRKDEGRGQGMNLSIRSKAAPLLLKLRWQGYPLVHSRQHAWLYKVPIAEAKIPTPEEAESDNAAKPVTFSLNADLVLEEDKEHVYYKLPHKDGADGNVGSPLAKTFISAFEDGILSSQYPAAASALEMNAQCSYWTSARERVLNQLVVWEKQKGDFGFPLDSDKQRHGVILPQVITMGTVTRRAVESTWLAAANAKKNRLGTELKAMIRAPPGYAIVGADVHSEELWICCVMGDAQFGVHGATAIGWMTLEGTKSAGTDLHSKTASILGISRDKAKVFNYSRIYGAGVKHAVQLLLQSNPTLSKTAATDLAKTLYASTKGLKQHTANNRFERKFWYGGTESHVFNTLEAVAMAADPRTPALGCGITAALAKANLPATVKAKAGEDFMPSRINWVVQSSGVDYLHMLVVSMDYLCRKFDINARFMISVHDEIRYLVKEDDQYRAALALQVSNVWTRALFSYRLQMESLPQSCAFFSAVDIDHVLRKEVNMDCVTPSQPVPIPHGTSQIIEETVNATNGGSLFADGRNMEGEAELPGLDVPSGRAAYTPSAITYRREGWDDVLFLEAQNAIDQSTLKNIMGQRAPTPKKTPSSRKPPTPRKKGQPKQPAKDIQSDDLDWDWDLTRAAPSYTFPINETARSVTPSATVKPKLVQAPISSLPLRRAPERRSRSLM